MAPIQGFDSGSYPGDAAVTAWANGGSPFSFLGFYLDAPCHSPQSFTTYSGKLAFLKSLGWGIALLYVGRQVNGCGSAHLTAAFGASDSADAIAKATAEGFSAHAIIYLDVEPFGGPVPAAMEAYLSAWIDALLNDGMFEPGIYCHTKNAIDLHLIGEARYANAGRVSGAPSFWVTHDDGSYVPGVSTPADSGIAFADIWQGMIDQRGVTFAGVSLDIDLNVSNFANPSNA
jgi:hypothetical protein